MANLSNINNKLIVTDGGHLLINQTANNNYRLQMDGADGTVYAWFKSNVATTGARIGLNSDDFRVYNQQASGNLSLGTVGTERMKIDQFGQIFALGQMRLEVAATETNPLVGTNCAFMFQNTSNTDGNLAVIDFRNSTGFVTGRIGAQFLDAGDRNTDLYFMTRANGGGLTERMRIKSDGNIDIITPITNGFFGLSLKYSTTEVAVFKVNNATGQIDFGGNAAGYFPTFASAGIERMRIDSSGDVTIQTSGADDIKNFTINSSNGSSQVAGLIIQNDGANGYINFKLGAGNAAPTTKLTIGNAANFGNVGIGADAPRNKLTVFTAGAAEEEIALRLVNPIGFTNAGSGASIIFAQDRSQTENLPTAKIRSSQAAAGTSCCGDLIFSTHHSGVSGMTDKYKITAGGVHQWTSDGNFNSGFNYSFRDAVGINNPNSVSATSTAGYVLSVGRSTHGSIAGGIISQGESHFVRGISFGASGQGQVMDHYQQGIWTPTLRFGGNEVGLTYGGAPQSVYRGGHFVKIGNVVTFSFRIILTSKGTSVGSATIHGLPYVVGGLPGNYGSAMYSFANNFAIPERATVTIDSSSDIIRLRFVSSTGAFGNVTNSGFNNNSDIILTGTYISA